MSKKRSFLNYLYLYFMVKSSKVKSDLTDCSKNRCKLWCQTKNVYNLQHLHIFNSSIFFYPLSLFLTHYITYTLLSLSPLIHLYFSTLVIEFGYRHRALRSNLLSKKRSKGFPLQSLTQNHLLIHSFKITLRLYFVVRLVAKWWPIGHAPLTNPQHTNMLIA